MIATRRRRRQGVFLRTDSHYIQDLDAHPLHTTVIQTSSLSPLFLITSKSDSFIDFILKEKQQQTCVVTNMQAPVATTDTILYVCLLRFFLWRTKIRSVL